MAASARSNRILTRSTPTMAIVRSPLWATRVLASRGSSVPTLRTRPAPVIVAPTGGVISDWPNPTLSSPGGPSPTSANAGAANRTSTTPKGNTPLIETSAQKGCYETDVGHDTWLVSGNDSRHPNRDSIPEVLSGTKRKTPLARSLKPGACHQDRPGRCTPACRTSTLAGRTVSSPSRNRSDVVRLPFGLLGKASIRANAA